MKAALPEPITIRDGNRKVTLRAEGERVMIDVDAGLRFSLPIARENARRVYEWLRALFGEEGR